MKGFVLKTTWLETLRDWLSVLVAFLVVVAPVLLFSILSLTFQSRVKDERVAELTETVILDFEILLDHLNSALINLYSSYSHCDTDIRNHMHKLSFDLPGVEAFAFIDRHGEVRCSNWLRNVDSYNLGLHLQRPGLNLSGEEYISQIGKSGVLAYRSGPNDGLVVALISSNYLRQFISKNIPVEDTLVLYSQDVQKQIVMNGILPASRLRDIEDQMRYGSIGHFEGEENLQLSISAQYPAISAAYFKTPEPLGRKLLSLAWQALLILVLSIFAAWGWLSFRHQRVNSIQYQIRQGLHHEEFEPYLQPIVDMRSGRWIGAESLARWNRNGHPVAYPDEFIPEAELSGDIKALTRQVTDRLCRYANTEFQGEESFYFSINLSPNFIDESTESAVANFEARFESLSSHNIRFEITEHGLQQTNKALFSQTVSRLRQKGYLIGLDDFGTGQSGLEYFSNLTPDFLKIDRRFVKAIDSPESVDFQLLKTIVQLAKSLGMTIIAEGVENEQERDWLLDNDILYAQGWLYQKAVPLDEFSAYYQTMLEGLA